MGRDPTVRAVTEDRGLFEERGAPPPHVAMQRVLVRMLFDPAFVERIYDDPVGALRGLSLPEDLMRQLLANDRRLWGADRLRRRRALKVLLEEFKVASALYLALTSRLAGLEAFFGSEPFHEAVQRRGYMALAFAAFLEDAFGGLGDRAVHGRAALALEEGMARCRRLAREARRGRDPLAGSRAAEGGTCAALAATAAVADLPGGTLELVQHVEAWLFEIGLLPAAALCEDAPRPEPLPELRPDRPVTVLLECREDRFPHVDVTLLEEPWRAVVRACAQRPVSRRDLEARVGPEAAPRAWERAGSLVEAGVLRLVQGGA